MTKGRAGVWYLKVSPNNQDCFLLTSAPQLYPIQKNEQTDKTTMYCVPTTKLNTLLLTTNL